MSEKIPSFKVRVDKVTSTFVNARNEILNDVNNVYVGALMRLVKSIASHSLFEDSGDSVVKIKTSITLDRYVEDFIEYLKEGLKGKIEVKGYNVTRNGSNDKSDVVIIVRWEKVKEYRNINETKFKYFESHFELLSSVNEGDKQTLSKIMSDIFSGFQKIDIMSMENELTQFGIFILNNSGEIKDTCDIIQDVVITWCHLDYTRRRELIGVFSACRENMGARRGIKDTFLE